MIGARRLTRLESGALRAELAPELGGRLHRLQVDGFDVLHSPATVDAAVADPFHWSSFVMAPWCGRLPHALLPTVDGPVQLESNFPDGSAIHGEVYARPWRQLDDGVFEIEGGDFGFPWRYRVRGTVALDDCALSYRLELRNEDDRAMPAGLGWHPWFNAADLRVELPVSRSYELDGAYRPIGDPRPATPPDRFSPGQSELYTGLDGRPCRLRWSGAGVAVALETGRSVTHLVVYAPPDFPALAVEPQTHAPDGHQRLADGYDDGVAMLEPGETLELALRLVVEDRA